ncbi:hyaluronidase-like [Chiloscyllium plagiosum]|uniref:hyaluronidase-like n=1 Tax=Chiloscyllium plagiosum TaxID=36176 RepID=UPI001CB7F3B1|nr:hyaluronidase-like [Chiloscyllium plagiosum]
MLSALTQLTCTLVYLSTHLPTISGVEAKPTLPSPMIYNKPFSVIWNTPIANCNESFGIKLDLDEYGIVANENGLLIGKKITIFYKRQLGLYPFYTDEGIPINGGLVQNASLSKHLDVATGNINSLMDQDFSGLAVVDWEAWRPLWVRNWGVMDIYRKNSIELERSKQSNLTEDEINKNAINNFQTAAKAFMADTLELGHTKREKGCWGFYKYPDCYNYFNKLTNYTGQCLKQDSSNNNKLTWLWEKSQCLYPSVYIPQRVANSDHVQKFTHYRVKEALRIAAYGRSKEALPVLVYARYSYRQTLDFLSEIDLVHTIGEMAAMGASGVILWGNNNYARTEETCSNLKTQIDENLGKFVKNITTATMWCSRLLCNSNGRCLRKDTESKAYLFLDSNLMQIISAIISDNIEESREEILSKAKENMKAKFKCQCYKAGLGSNCEAKSGS